MKLVSTRALMEWVLSRIESKIVVSQLLGQSEELLGG